MITHFSSQPRRLRIATCGQLIDGVENVQTMMIGEVDCDMCLAAFRVTKRLGGHSSRPPRR